MKIECTLKRKGGTVAEIDGTEYHFQPDADGRHVAEVADEKHINRFLDIREGYRCADKITATIPEAAAKSAVTPAEDPAYVPESVTEPDDNEVDLEAYRKELAEAYKAKFGRRPHHKWSIEKIEQELAKKEA